MWCFACPWSSPGITSSRGNFLSSTSYFRRCIPSLWEGRNFPNSLYSSIILILIGPIYKWRHLSPCRREVSSRLREDAHSLCHAGNTSQIVLCYQYTRSIFQEQTINFSSKCTYCKFVCQVEWRCLPPWLWLSKSVIVLNRKTNSLAFQPLQAPLVWGLSLSKGEGEETIFLDAPCYDTDSWS